MKKWMAVLMVMSLFALAACNTIEGAGRDLEKAGEKVQEEVQDAKS